MTIEQRLAVTIPVKRGMKTFSAASVPIRFADVLVRPRLPSVPKQFGHLKAAAPPGGWGMLGNDNYGDCVMAGAAHESMLWAWATGRPIPRFDSNVVVTQYLQQTGGSDDGLDPVATARWRMADGVRDLDGNFHKLGAFVLIEDLEQLELCAYIGGAAAMCWALPNSAEQQFGREQVWDDMSHDPDPNAGHYTVFGGVNSKGHREILTWGRIQGCSREYCEKYMNSGGCLGYLSREYMLEAGTTPEAVAWDDLNQMMREASRGR